jgi:hypothetical protein
VGYIQWIEIVKINLLLNVGGLLGSIVNLLGGIKTTEDSGKDGSIGDVLVLLHGLDAGFLVRDDLGDYSGLGEVDLGGGLAGGDNEDREGDGSLFLALGGVELELTKEGVLGSLLDLSQGDGSEANWGVNAGVVIEDLDEEVVLALGLVSVEGEVLLEIGVTASVLLDSGLLEGLLVLEVGGHLDIGIVLAEALLGGSR